MPGDGGGGTNGAQLGGLARAVADAVPGIVEQLRAAQAGRVYRDVLELLERPLLVHALRMTGGNQLRAARLLGVNRNTLRKRCRELRLPLPRGTQRPRSAPASPPLS